MAVAHAAHNKSKSAPKKDNLMIGLLIAGTLVGIGYELTKKNNSDTSGGSSSGGTSYLDPEQSLADQLLSLPGSQDTIVFPSNSGDGEDSSLLSSLAAMLTGSGASTGATGTQEPVSKKDAYVTEFFKEEEQPANVYTSVYSPVNAGPTDQALSMGILGALGSLPGSPLAPVATGLTLMNLFGLGTQASTPQATTDTSSASKKAAVIQETTPANSYTPGRFTTDFYQGIAEAHPSVMAGGSDTAAYGSFVGYGMSVGAKPDTFYLGSKLNENTNNYESVELVTYRGGGWEARSLTNGMLVASGTSGSTAPAAITGSSKKDSVGISSGAAAVSSSSSKKDSVSAAMRSALSSPTSGYNNRTVGTTPSGTRVAGH